MRWLVSLALLGCGDGQPWGIASGSLEARFDVNDRLDAGRVMTALDYRVAVEQVTIEVSAIELLGGGSGRAFDPADPPEGYTLCHNGHCHTDDGRVVAYAEIDGASDAQVLVRWPAPTLAIDETVALAAQDVLAPIAVDAVSVTGSVHVVARVYDARGTRLDAAGVALDVSVPDVTWVAPAETRFGPADPLGARFAVTLAIPASLFDDVDFATSLATPLIATRLVEDGTLAIVIHREE